VSPRTLSGHEGRRVRARRIVAGLFDEMLGIANIAPARR
jgi:hypothetical protein